MNNSFLLCVITFTLISCGSTQPDGRPSQDRFVECGVTDEEYDRLMTLPQKDFDQDFRGGWRAVSRQEDCNSVAGYLIEDYIQKHDIIPLSGNNILFWHAGQTHANSGNYERAIVFFTDAYTPNLHPDEHGYEWGLYAEGTIAFLQDDLISLTAKRDTLAAIEVSEAAKQSRRKFLLDNPNITMPEGFIDEPQNLTPLNNLIACFGRPYEEAYHGKCEKTAN